MTRNRICLFTLALGAFSAAPALAISITNVVETGGDNEATDTITAKWTGTTWPISIANEPFPGAVVGNNYTVLSFGNNAPSYVDRNHKYVDDTAARPVPAYLVGGDYIMSGNDNRDNASYKLDVTVNSVVTAYLLIDNRLSDGSNANPPTFDATHMQWVQSQGFIATNNGLNRTASTAVPDEVAIDENADGSVNNWFSVYKKTFSAGTFGLLQADNTGNNMYGVVVVPSFLPGDVDKDNDVDINDFNAIRDHFQQTATMREQGDLNGDGVVSWFDYREWKDHFPTAVGSSGAVPEPATAALGLTAMFAATALRRVRRGR